jgi:hypothetical protein
VVSTSTSVASDAGPKLSPVPELGRAVVQGWFHVDFNSTTDITIVYDVSTADLKVANHQLHFLWQKQAGRPNDKITVTFTLPKRTVSTDLSVDREVIFDYRR